MKARIAATHSRAPGRLECNVRRALARAREYLIGRQCADGGFCFYRSEYVEESNLRDTYHAVASLALVGMNPPRKEQVVAFVENSTLYGISYLYHYAFALELLGSEPHVDRERMRRLRVRKLDVNSGESVSAWLEETFYAIRLQRRFGHLPHRARIAALVRQLESGGGFGKEPNLIDTYFGVGILSAIGEGDRLAETRSFVSALQAPGLGFNPTRKTRATSLETIHAGVNCCRMLGIETKYAADILAFVLSCQSRDGAFAREPVALPDIELTHQALEITAVLAPGALGDGT